MCLSHIEELRTTNQLISASSSGEDQSLLRTHAERAVREGRALARPEREHQEWVAKLGRRLHELETEESRIAGKAMGQVFDEDGLRILS